MKIIVDAMGGDNAPQAIVQGALDSAKEFGVNIVLIERPELPDTEEEDVTPDTPFADPEEEEDVTPDIPFADPENETEDIPEEDITVDIPFASPVTGDATNIVILICLSVVAAIAAGFVTLTKKNTKNN